MQKIKRAIISVTDKSGIAEFSKALSAAGVEIISTGGTAKAIEEAGVRVIPMSSYTGFPEMLDGRVKTLHPKIHGGLLAVRDDAGHARDMKTNGILPIDMVVVNLYAFEKTVEKGAALAEAIENIDIGGPCMLRAAAKNHRFVAAVTDPADYQAIIDEMKQNDGALSPQTRFHLARKVYALTARYDGAIANHLGSLAPDGTRTLFPETFTVQYERLQGLRYGENPHQQAAFYKRRGLDGGTLPEAKKLQGKELSYNNILDLDACIRLVNEFHDPCAVLIKHNNPSGVAVSKDGVEAAFEKALACDKTSAFGGIFGFNREVDSKLARRLKEIFFEVIVAPSYTAGALEEFAAKKNVRVMELPALAKAGRKSGAIDIRGVSGGALMQTPDEESAADLKPVTERRPSEAELTDLLFAWSVAKHVKSNVIVLARDGATVGIGAGQMSRIDSTKIAVMKAGDAGLSTRGAALASDAFFPFRDNVDLAAAHGVTAIIQPGGSIRDEEVLRAADEHGIAMVFTGERHFRH